MHDKEQVAGYSFGDFRLDARRRQLCSCDGDVRAVTTKCFDTLLYLVEHAGEVVTKPALMAAVWPGVCVEENSLSQCISALRRVLGETAGENRFIVTVPGRGYRFIARVAAQRDDVAARQPGLPSVAVLPFKLLDGSPGHESLGLGMTDALIMRIGTLRGIDLRPLSSVRRFANPDQDPVAAGRALGVDTVLDGWVQRDGERLRASVRLLETAGGRQLWADRFDAEFTDVFGIQDVMAERVATGLLHELSIGDLRRLRRHPTENAHAYQLYVSGWYALTRPGGGNLKQALQYLEQAVALEPEFALAHVCLAGCYALFGVFGFRQPHEVFPSARAGVLRALEIDPELAEAHAALGHIHTVYDLDWARARKAYDHALAVDPRCSMAHHYLGLQMLVHGRFEEALDHVRRAQALEPLAANYNANIGMIHHYAGRYEAAVEQLQATLRLDPSFDHARTFMGRALLQLGEFERAIRLFQERTSATLGADADLPVAYASSGRRAQAERELRALLEDSTRRYVSPYDIARIHAALGLPDATLDWLEQALDQRTQPINYVSLDPGFASLRAHPRFCAMVARLAA